MARSALYLYWGRYQSDPPEGQIRRKEVHGGVGLATEVETWLVTEGPPTNLLVVGEHLYWTLELTGQPQVRTAFFRAALSATVAPAGPLFERAGEVGSLTSDATHLYWSETETGEGNPSDGNIARVPLQAGETWQGDEVFNRGAPAPRAVAVGEGQVVWASSPWPLGALYLKATSKNETNLASVLVGEQDRPFDVVFLGNAVHWINLGDDGNNDTGRKAMRKALPSGQVEVLASMDGRPQRMAARDGVVAWVAGVEANTGSVWALRPGEAAVRLVDGASQDVVVFPQAIAVDKRAVYWTNNDSTVMAVGHCACTPP